MAVELGRHLLAQLALLAFALFIRVVVIRVVAAVCLLAVLASLLERSAGSFETRPELGVVDLTAKGGQVGGLHGGGELGRAGDDGAEEVGSDGPVLGIKA